MSIGFLLDVFKKKKEKDAIIWKDKIYNYGWLLKRITYWQEQIRANNIPNGTVTIIEADFSPNAVALFLVLIEYACIIVPLSSSVESKKSEFIEIAQGEISFVIDDKDQVQIKRLSYFSDHEFYKQLRSKNHPGLVLFSSGSTGKSKAAVHNLNGILDKFKISRHSLRSISFLLYDHIGGLNTMLYNLSNAGCIVTVQNRSPDEVLSAIEKYQVELLPTSPTFITLIILSEAYKRYDLSSLKIVTYGTEPMLEYSLKYFNKLFPQVKLLQTYGLSEVGILRSKSKSSESLWVKVGGEGFQTRVVDGILQIKAQSAMLGYLNESSPFTEDGWLNTGDSVEVDGEYIRILGRKSEMINVGGKKLYPAEVENVIQEMSNVADVTVYSEKNSILGNIVCAKVSLLTNEDHKKFIKKLKKLCREKLETYKVPVKFKIVDVKLHSERFKKIRDMK